jgi:hypothetical protein
MIGFKFKVVGGYHHTGEEILLAGLYLLRLSSVFGDKVWQDTINRNKTSAYFDCPLPSFQDWTSMQ